MNARLKNILIVLLVVVYSNSYGQKSSSFTIQDYVEKLKIHLDSFQNIIPIQSGKFLINSDSINLRDEFPKCYYDYETKYPQIVSYILQGSNDSLAVLLFFYENRLLEFAVLTKGSTLINNCDIYIQQSCKNSNIDISYTPVSETNLYSERGKLNYKPQYTSKYIEAYNKTLEFEFFEYFLMDIALFSVSDKKTWSVIPSWCGIDSKKKKLMYLNLGRNKD